MFTVVAKNPSNDQLGDALYVQPNHLVEAVEQLMDYWLGQQHEDDFDYGVHCEVYQDRVSDGDGVKPLPWIPGETMYDTEGWLPGMPVVENN